MSAPRAVPDVPMSETELLRLVLDLAELLGWTRAHFRPALTKHGWRTPVQADGAGFPDLVLVRERVLFVELKATRGRLSQEQAHWINALRRAGADVFVWRPDDWDAIVVELQRRNPSIRTGAHDQ